MIITISGRAGTGKSTVAKLAAKKLKLRHYSTGDFMREIARDKKITLLELGRSAEKNSEIDRLLDKRQINLGKEQDNFVIDARLGFYFIPHSIKIFLTAGLKTRAERIFRDKRASEKNLTLKQTIANIRKREESERKRYRKYYKLDYLDEKHYDLVINTSKITAEKTASIIVTFIKGKKLHK